MAAHKHAEIIKAWADGAQIQVRDGQNWYDIDDGNQIFSKHFEYRIKPSEPEREYPVVMIDGSDLEFRLHSICGRNGTTYHDDLQEFASWIVRELCDNGQVVPRAEFDRAIGDRAARDMAVARAVSKASAATTDGSWDTSFEASAACTIHRRIAQELDLTTIVSQVK